VDPGLRRECRFSASRRAGPTPEQAAAELKKAAAGGNIIWLLNRHGATQFVGLSVSGAGSSTPPR